MKDIRQEIIIALARLQRYIEGVPPEEIDRFLRGRSFNVQVVLDEWVLKDSESESNMRFPEVLILTLTGCRR